MQQILQIGGLRVQDSSDFVQLKKLLKQLPAAEDRTEAEQDFFRQLRAEVRAVNQCALCTISYWRTYAAYLGQDTECFDQ